MSDTALMWIEYVVVPGGVQILGSVALGLVERSRRKKEGKADPNRFTVKLPMIYIISLLACFIVFTTVTLFFNQQIARNPSCCNLFAKIFLNIGMIALAITSLVYVYIYLRRKIEVVCGVATVTPAFSKPYSFTRRDVKDVKFYSQEITVKLSRKKINVYKICHCSGLFENWLGWVKCD
ncbi:MAG: hypothetical protein K2H30_04370 [Clostridia bacterium]|nr:hypothetical protein [Clostridia bacterium]MDE7265067.1 hypothetical protein [Clostridia bacterium]